MKLPGRSGALSASGLWQEAGSGNPLPANPVYSSRSGNEPLEYKATETISFVEGFESGVNDAFEAYLTTDNGSGSGGNGGSAAGLYADGGYRYGFNGKEQDPEVSSDGNQYDYGFRIYDPRIGRFKSVDPLTASYPWYTPYQFAGNKPIMNVDMDGKEDKWYMVEIFLNGTNTKIEKINITNVGTYSNNNGPRQNLPQGPKGPGIQFNVQVWHWEGNRMVQEEAGNPFFAASKQNKGFWDKVSDFFSGLRQSGSILKGGNSPDGMGGSGHVNLVNVDEIDISTITAIASIASAKPEALSESLHGKGIGKVIHLLEGVKNAGEALNTKDEILKKKKELDDDKEKKESEKREPDTILPAGSDSCTICNKVEPKDSMNHHVNPEENYHGNKTRTKATNKIPTIKS
ncbi:RHS repeat-associated core domain-containing protein [Flavisolibacter nicotianae]|uniref:RHS repeat-associated core domain-containing protein n=1 Tax=Flavisolibacter nicotianae TaxID=2364882 RepID=UPI000EB31AD6|nr:RHS repeat-associated core domain-containing protein [Flavisolibacter nicotianae]